MPIIEVAKPFCLKDDKNKLTQFIPGKYEVEPEVAEHWYTKAHLVGFVEPPPKTGSYEYGQMELLAAQAARLNEAPADAPQPPAEAPTTEAPPRRVAGGGPPKVQFAGRRGMPKEPDATPSFINPRGE